MTQLRPGISLPLLLLAAACGTGEARDMDDARVSDAAPVLHEAHAPGTAADALPPASAVDGDAALAASGDEGEALAVSSVGADADVLPRALVYKTPTCGCCSLWIDHLREAGFEVDARDLNDIIPVKIDAGVPPRMSSCHTALIDGYVVEGHIPAEHVKRLLEERPDIVGIAVPGMPIGSPGMEGLGARPYQVLSWDRAGNVEVYAEVDPRR